MSTNLNDVHLKIAEQNVRFKCMSFDSQAQGALKEVMAETRVMAIVIIIIHTVAARVKSDTNQ